MFKKLLLIMTFTISMPIFACDKNKTPVFSSTKNKIVVSQKNPQFSITLKANPSTGYTWNVANIDSSAFKNMFKNTGHKYVASNTKLMGAPGYDVWTFKAIYPKIPFRVNPVGHVIMEYKKPWMKNETKDVTVKRFIIVLKK